MHQQSSTNNQQPSDVQSQQERLLLRPDEPTTTGVAVTSKLASKTGFLPTIDSLYAKYGQDIASFCLAMRKWCESTKSCNFFDLEAEMLY
jgi:hypothetical protein